MLGDDSHRLVYDNPKSLFDQRDEIWEKLSALTRKWTTHDLLEALLAVDIWCGEVKTHLQAADDPQVRHMNMITSYDHPVGGTVKVVAPATKLSETPASVDRPPPLIGEHTRRYCGNSTTATKKSMAICIKVLSPERRRDDLQHRR